MHCCGQGLQLLTLFQWMCLSFIAWRQGVLNSLVLQGFWPDFKFRAVLKKCGAWYLGFAGAMLQNCIEQHLRVNHVKSYAVDVQCFFGIP